MTIDFFRNYKYFELTSLQLIYVYKAKYENNLFIKKGT